MLSGVAERINGWIVAEREPLTTARPPDGTRYDALANIALLRIPKELSRAEWLHNWQDRHTTVAIETQATFGYVQNTVVAAVTPGPRVDALVEELFPMDALTDQHAFWGSGGDDAELQRRAGRMMAGVATFGADRDLDVIPTSRYRYDLTAS
ncbi:EthD domain-containing protein [Nocardia nova]|uniref:EthD domain-containing protein n=1 Tax=Nocardia nova TaxID=37330 RepID=UPI0015E3D712